MRPRAVTVGVEMFAALTPTLAPATHTNSYALGDRDVVLVEPATPYEDEQRAWLEWARGISAQGRHLRAIVLTHHHADHMGGAEYFAKELSLPIWAHPKTAARLPNLRVDRALEDGDAIDLEGAPKQRWEVLHTPGHAPGHVCLFERTIGAVVVGDMVASVGTILIEPKDGDMAEYLRQLERLATLDAAVALPAHGDPIDEPSKLFRKYIAHRLAREAKVLEAVREKPGASSRELVPIAYADTPKLLWPIAKLSLEAHLEKLVAEGRVDRAGDAFTARASSSLR